MYLWIKVLHVLAIVSWMAALLYLPRLFVYHADVSKGSATSETFKVMERRLAKAIMTPAMIVTWATGLWMAWDASFFKAGWFHGKLLLVVLMSAVHGLLIVRLKAFAQDRDDKSGVYYRVLNEVPTLLMIGVVILVIVKPF
jgi:putative membrane protein